MRRRFLAPGCAVAAVVMLGVGPSSAMAAAAHGGGHTQSAGRHAATAAGSGADRNLSPAVRAFLRTSIPKTIWVTSDGTTVKVVDDRTGAVLYRASKAVWCSLTAGQPAPDYALLPADLRYRCTTRPVAPLGYALPRT